jgi:hypothetical protein
VLLLHVTAELWALPLGARTEFLLDTLVANATGSCYWPCRFGRARCKFLTGLQLLYPSLKLLEVGYSFGEDRCFVNLPIFLKKMSSGFELLINKQTFSNQHRRIKN